MTRPLAVVTGASSGLGAVYARRLAVTHDLLLVARREDRLHSLADELRIRHGTRVEMLVADLTDAAQLQVVADRLSTDSTLDLLVNNAGVGTRGSFWDTPLEDQKRMHELNVLAVLHLTHAALRNMVPRCRGTVINVASVAGFVRRAGSVSYGSSKAWVVAFSEALHLDLQRIGSPVRIQALCPGFTYTEFHDVMKLDRRQVAAQSLWLDANFVVDRSLRALRSGRLFVVPGWRYWLIVNLISILPLSLRVLLEQQMTGKPHV